MLSQRNKTLCAILLLLAVANANAFPTVTADNSVVPAIRQVPDASIILASNEVTQPVDSKLADIARELLQPPVSSSVLSNTGSSTIKSLPVVPAALFMVLTGFLCVSLVKDRKVWLAALAGLIWAGQTGIQALPQLAIHLSHRNHAQQQHPAGLVYPYQFENSSRLRSDIEGTRYIGLLRHLAGIPHNNKTAAANRLLDTLAGFTSRNFQKPDGRVCRYPCKNNYPSPSAFISEQYRLDPLFKCLAFETRQFVCFSPAFTFENIPRGPPNSSEKNSSNLKNIFAKCYGDLNLLKDTCTTILI